MTQRRLQVSIKIIVQTEERTTSCDLTCVQHKSTSILDEDVDHGEILPNHDGSFQMSIDLELPSDDWGKYECVFQLFGVKEVIVTKLEKREIETNYGNPIYMTIVTITAVLLLVTIVCAAGFWLHKKRNAKRPQSRK
ncbi:uncharacterized protein LKV04_002774 [Tautogolabrus adspersus]